MARELADRGYGVTALVRSPPAAGVSASLRGCDVRVTEVTDPQRLKDTLSDLSADAVISCIASRNGEPADAWRVDCEANRNLLQAARGLGADQFVLLSAICVQKPRLAFQHAKLAFEQELQSSGLCWSIVRPTAFFKSLSGQVERVRSGKPFVVFGNGTETACKPISAGDLARFIVDCLERRELQNRVLPIGGPGPALTPREQGELLFEIAGRQPKFRSVPVGIFDIATAVLSPLGRLSAGLAAKAELARIGRYYATESMLCWDAERDRYDADATPSTGSETLRDHYASMLREGEAGHELGEHKLF